MNIFYHLQHQDVIKSLKTRHSIKQSVHLFLNEKGFIEIDTPLLGPMFPEYTNDQFSVLSPDEFQYYLPQSPQIYKQILLDSGYDKYYQFAHCFRKEHNALDDQVHMGEFMQIDVELANATVDGMISLAEHMLQFIMESNGVNIQIPFQRIDGEECKKKYGTDKPNFSCEASPFEFVWIVNLPLLENSTSFERTKVTSIEVKNDYILSHHVFALPKDIPKSGNWIDLFNIKTHSFDLVLNGVEICSGDLRINDKGLQEYMLDILHVEKEPYHTYLNLLKGTYDNGGFAIGLDRLTMLLAGVEDISLTTAFSDKWWCD